MSRITLITNFKEKELDKINHQIMNIDYHMCKVPYGINDELRYELDNLPYHFTIFATDKQNERKLLNIASNIKMNKILWDLFKQTGDIKYFNLLGKIERSNSYENRKNRRHYSRGN